MANNGKCFCDLYRECQENPERSVGVGHSVVEDKEVRLSAQGFIESADRICPGTTVHIAQTALNAQTVTFNEATAAITLPREAVNLQCEYFAAVYGNM